MASNVSRAYVACLLVVVVVVVAVAVAESKPASTWSDTECGQHGLRQKGNSNYSNSNGNSNSNSNNNGSYKCSFKALTNKQTSLKLQKKSTNLYLKRQLLLLVPIAQLFPAHHL